MKRMVFTLLMVAFAAVSYGQKDALDDFFDSYSDREGYSSVIINGNFFGLLGNFSDDPELDCLDRKVTSIRIVSRKDNRTGGETDFASQLRNVIRKGRYEEMITVQDHNSNVRCMVRSNGDVIKEILLLASGKNEAVIQIRGTMTREDVDRLMEDHSEGIARLEMLESSGK